MTHAFYECSRPVIIAHRGASRYAPENTIAAFDLARQQGVMAVELDTMLSRDGIPVVIHDRRLERTTNGRGMVDQLTYDELAELDAGASFSDMYKGERIPCLAEILKRYRSDLIINIELKNLHSPFDNLVETVVGMIDEMDLSNFIIYSSFLPSNLKKVKKLSPLSKTAIICPPGIKGSWFASRIFLPISRTFIHPFRGDISRDRIKREHQRNRCVNAWTVNDAKIAKELAQMKIDGMITDDPPAIFSAVRP